MAYYSPAKLGEAADLAWQIPLILFGLLLAIGFLWAPYAIYKDAAMKLDYLCAPSLEIEPIPNCQEGHDADGQYKLFYLTIRNPSGVPLEQVEVELENIIPAVENLDWLPVSLHIKHDNQPTPKQHFDLSPGATKHIDFVWSHSGSRQINVCHIVPGVNTKVPNGMYVMEVKAQARNVAVPSKASFLVRIDQEGNLVCYLADKEIESSHESLHKLSRRL